MQLEPMSKSKGHSSHAFSQVVKLQQLLCYEKNLMLSQNQHKSRFRQNIEDWLRLYFTSYINIIKSKTNNPRIKISDDDLFGNTYNFVKEVILLLSKDYNLMAHVLQTQPDDSKLVQLLPTIVTILYENCVDDGFESKDITKLIAKILIKSLNQKLNFLETQIIGQFFRRPECLRYGQIISKSALLVLSSGGSTKQNLEDIKQITRQSFPKMKFQKSEVPLIEHQNSEVERLVKSYFSTILNSQFHVPVSIRILMKMIEMQREGQLEEKLIELFWGQLFKMYQQALKFPDQYIKKLQIKDQKVLSSIELANNKLDTFKTKFAQFKNYNKLSEEYKTEIKQFINKLLILPSNMIPTTENESRSSLKLYSACFSVEQMIILLKCLNQTPSLKQINQKIATRVSRIKQMSEQFTDFCKTAAYNQVYCIFYQLSLPKQIDIDYAKKYEQIYSQRKLESLIRQILTTIQPIQVYLASLKVKSFKDLLTQIQSDPEQEQNTNPDKVAFFVNIKYLLWMSREKDMEENITQMLNQTQSNKSEWLALFSKTKTHLTNALYYLKGYSERTSQVDHKMRQANLMMNIRQYLQNFSFNICVSSPSSRQKQFQTSGKLLIMNHERILLQKWENCVHQKMKLKGELDKMLHVRNFDEMIQAFCHLEEVKNSIQTGIDKVAINMNFSWFLSHIFEQASVQTVFKKSAKDFKDYLEIIATKKVYSLIFPKQPTVRDLDIHNKLHYFRLLQPKHLGLELKQVKPLWELTNKHLADLHRAPSTIKKFESLKQFMKVINGILLANQQTNKHTLERIILYAFLKSDQKQIASNIAFMQIFTDPARMVSAEGAFVAHLKASLRELEELTFSKLEDIDEIAYNKQFQKLEKEMQLRQKSQSVEHMKQQ